MHNPPRVLIVGKMGRGSNSRSFADGVASLVPTAKLDVTDLLEHRVGSSAWLYRRKFSKLPAAINGIMRQRIRRAIDEFRPDVLICVKTVSFDQDIFASVPVGVKLHVSFDDVSNADNVTPQYLEFEQLWDGVVTTKRHNVAELHDRGVRRVIFTWAAYDPALHNNTVPYMDRRLDVSFIGVARPDRRILPQRLASSSKSAAVYGPRWRRIYPFGVPGLELHRGVFGNDYMLAANSAKVGLVLLNSANRDSHTNRSFELPAMGQLVLAPRTSDHLELFRDGENAVLFDGEDDLWPKLHEILSSPDQGRAIAAGGEALMRQGHTFADRARLILDEVALWCG